MALYNYTALVGGSCGISDDYPSNQTCVTIRDCNRDVYGHLRAFSITNDDIKLQEAFKKIKETIKSNATDN